MATNGKAIAQAILIGGSLVASAGAIVAWSYWGGALSKDLETHKEQPYHPEAGRRLRSLEKDLSGLDATVRATSKATDEKIEDLKEQQQRNHNEIKQLLRQQN